MPPTRMAIVEALAQHGFTESRGYELDGLVDSILRLWPEPDRAALEAALVARMVWNITDEQIKTITDVCMDFCRGEAALPKEWCSHIQLYGNHQWYIRGVQDDKFVPDCWDQCPVSGCHAPRPSQP